MDGYFLCETINDLEEKIKLLVSRNKLVHWSSNSEK